MKEIIVCDIENLEKEYLDSNSAWMMEESILSSFSPKELRGWIKELNQDYLEYKLSYLKETGELQKKVDSELGKYVIQQMQYYLNGGEELEVHKLNVIKRYENFYTRHYSHKHSRSKFQYFDIKSVPIVEVLSHYMRVPTNPRRNIICPLHDEKTGSFKIYTNSNSWFCFGCQKGGNIVNFVAEIEGISNKEAYIKLANLYSNQHSYVK